MVVDKTLCSQASQVFKTSAEQKRNVYKAKMSFNSTCPLSFSGCE